MPRAPPRGRSRKGREVVGLSAARAARMAARSSGAISQRAGGRAARAAAPARRARVLSKGDGPHARPADRFVVDVVEQVGVDVVIVEVVVGRPGSG